MPSTSRAMMARNALRMLNEPHGGVLVNTMVAGAEKDAAIKACEFTVELNERQLCDVELLMQGGFSPLTGFMDEADYVGVVSEDMKTANGNITIDSKSSAVKMKQKSDFKSLSERSFTLSAGEGGALASSRMIKLTADNNFNLFSENAGNINNK